MNIDVSFIKTISLTIYRLYSLPFPEGGTCRFGKTLGQTKNRFSIILSLGWFIEPLCHEVNHRLKRSGAFSRTF